VALESKTYLLKAPFGELFLCLPEPLTIGLVETHRGIELIQHEVQANSCSIRVDKTDGVYQINRPRTEFEVQYSDLIDCLNELLLQLIYEFMILLPDWELLHCSAAQSKSGKSIVAFGDKRAGKSVWSFQQTLMGGKLLADDLLAWDRVKSRFICFGVASRLRRPVDHAAFETLPKEAFLPGERLSYVRHTYLNLAACGEQFLPDRIVEIDRQSHSPKPISMLKILDRIQRSCIPRSLYC